MKRITPEVRRCFERLHTVIVATVDGYGRPHTSVKGLLRILSSGIVRLADLYHGQTYRNIKKNPLVSLTVVDAFRFQGYCLKGRATLSPPGIFSKHERGLWEKRLSSRIADRILKNLREEKKLHPGHPEAGLPKPLYVIEVKVEHIVDLARHSKR